MHIRSARRDEAAAIADAVAAQPLFERYGQGRASLERSVDQALARGDGVVVAEEDGAVVGFAWFLPSGTLSLGGYLRLIAVAPGHEGHGTGGLLLDEVERLTAPHSRHLFLLVSQGNDAAVRFYAARGYREVGPLPQLVRADITEVLLWKRLPRDPL